MLKNSHSSSVAGTVLGLLAAKGTHLQDYGKDGDAEGHDHDHGNDHHHHDREGLQELDQRIGLVRLIAARVDGQYGSTQGGSGLTTERGALEEQLASSRAQPVRAAMRVIRLRREKR